MTPREIELMIMEETEKAISEGVAHERLGVVTLVSVLSRLNQGGTIHLNDGALATSSSSLTDIPETFAEWANHFDLQSHIDRFVATALYLMEYQNQALFTKNHIVSLYEKARWSKPKNPADVLGKAATQMFFEEVSVSEEDGSKTWRLTKSGLRHLESLRKDEE
jgi:hypothetical protein